MMFGSEVGSFNCSITCSSLIRKIDFKYISIHSVTLIKVLIDMNNQYLNTHHDQNDEISNQWVDEF